MSDTCRIGALGDASPLVDPLAWVAPGAVLVGNVRLAPESSVWYGAVLRADEDEIVVERLGERRPFDRPWWRCPSCATPYRGRGLVPVAKALGEASSIAYTAGVGRPSPIARASTMS